MPNGEMVMVLSKDDILSSKRTMEVREVKNLGGNVNFRKLTIAETIDYEKATEGDIDGLELIALLASYSIADENGDRMFTPEEAQSIPFVALEEIAEYAQSVNGLSDDAVEENAKK